MDLSALFSSSTSKIDIDEGNFVFPLGLLVYCPVTMGLQYRPCAENYIFSIPFLASLSEGTAGTVSLFTKILDRFTFHSIYCRGGCDFVLVLTCASLGEANMRPENLGSLHPPLPLELGPKEATSRGNPVLGS